MQGDSDSFEKWEVNMVVSFKYVLSLLTNIYYIMIVIIYIKQRCTLSIKKGITLLLTFTLFTLNIFNLFVDYELIEKRNKDPKTKAPLFCVIRTSIRDTLILINSFHFSFIFLYTYIGLYHSEFLSKNKNKFAFLFMGLTWIVGIILCTFLCFDDSMLVINIGDCHTQKPLFFCLYIGCSLISLFIQIFSLIKIYLNLRKIDSSEEIETKAFKKKLFILGVVKASESLLYPLYFLFTTSLIMTILRVVVQVCVSFVFIVLYSYDAQFGKTMKELFCCEKESEPIVPHDAIYNELKIENTSK